MKKNTKRMIAVIMMLSMMVMSNSITHAYAVQNHDYVLDWIYNIKVLKNKVILKGLYAGYRLGVRIDGKTYYGEFADTNVEANEEGFIYDIVTLSVGYPILNEGETVSVWLEGRDFYKTEEHSIDVRSRWYNISAKAAPLVISGNVEQYGDYKIYVQTGGKEYLCNKTKVESSREYWGPDDMYDMGYEEGEEVEKTGYDFVCKLPKQKIGSTIKVVVRDTDGYENSESFKVENRTPKLQIDTVDTSVSEVSGTTSANSNISIKIGKKKYNCKSDDSGSFCAKIKMQKPGTKVKVKVTTPEGYLNEKQTKIKKEKAEVNIEYYVLKTSKKIQIGVMDARKGDRLKVYIGKKMYSYKFKKNRSKKKIIKFKIKKSKAGTKIKVCLYDRFKCKKTSCRDIVYYGNSVYKGMKMKYFRLTTWGKPDHLYNWGDGRQMWVYKYTDGSRTRVIIRNGVVTRVQNFY